MSSLRRILHTFHGHDVTDGAGVALTRVISGATATHTNPLLMIDLFDTANPADVAAGFPMHPHRGIETITYLKHGTVTHADSLGNQATATSGQLQWMCAGSGILHSEFMGLEGSLLGAQIWLNLPAADKFAAPSYAHITEAMCPTVELNDAVQLRVCAGRYGAAEGHKGDHVPLDLYELNFSEAQAEATLALPDGNRVIVLALKGDFIINNQVLVHHSAALLSDQGSLSIQSTTRDALALVLSAPELQEPVAWAGPIVMNTQDELEEAFAELQAGTFIKQDLLTH